MKIAKPYKICFLLLFGLFTLSASHAAENETANPEDDIITVMGTVRRFSDANGFYGIAGDDGKRYKPIGLTSGFEVEGLKVKARGRVLKKRLLFKPDYLSLEIIDITRAGRGEVVGKRVYSNPKRPVRVKQGENFIISLETNPTTGFVWQFAEPHDKSILTLENVEYVRNDDTGITIVGGGGEERWTFKAVAGGETLLSFKYLRPWEKDVPPAKKAVFKVILR